MAVSSDQVSRFVEENSFLISSYPKDICNKYTLLARLGGGTFGDVYSCRKKGEQDSVAEELAIKISKYTTDIIFTKESCEAVELESNFLRSIQEEIHARDLSILQWKDAFFLNQAKIQIAMVTKKCYTNLYQHLSLFYNGVSFDFIKDVIRQLVDVLAFLKERTIIHGDLKPENILINEQHSNQISVADFGSHLEGAYNVDEYVTIGYRAPEICFYGVCDCSSDVWSLGCILFHLLTGKELFPSEHTPDALRASIVELFKTVPISAAYHHGIQKMPYLLYGEESYSLHPQYRVGLLGNMQNKRDFVFQEIAYRSQFDPIETEEFFTLFKGFIKFNYNRRMKIEELQQNPKFIELVTTVWRSV